MDKFDAFIRKQYGDSLNEVLQKGGSTLDQLLNNLRLARGSTLNMSGILLFGSNPQRFRPQFIIKGVSFFGIDPAGTRYRDSQDFQGNLLELYKGAMSFLTRNLRWLQNGKGFNTEGDMEVPQAALEELVVNMLLHRDYFISAPWRVMIFDDRIELISPGALPNNLTIENIRNGVSVIRNPLIASFATKELPYRGIGTGILRAMAAIPDLVLQSDHERNLFIACIPRKDEGGRRKGEGGRRRGRGSGGFEGEDETVCFEGDSPAIRDNGFQMPVSRLFVTRELSGEASDPVDQKDIEGPIDEQILGACRFVKFNMKVAADKSPGRAEAPQYAMPAIFEAVVNAVAHRDYAIYGSKIRLHMVSDRLEIFSPGPLLSTLTIDSL